MVKFTLNMVVVYVTLIFFLTQGERARGKKREKERERERERYGAAELFRVIHERKLSQERVAERHSLSHLKRRRSVGVAGVILDISSVRAVEVGDGHAAVAADVNACVNARYGWKCNAPFSVNLPPDEKARSCVRQSDDVRQGWALARVIVQVSAVARATVVICCIFVVVCV